MKILVIEDEDGIGLVLKRLLGPIKERYPAAEIVWEKNMEGARKHLQAVPLPALIVADLVLPDSTLEKSVATVRTIHPFSPTVIFTGQDSPRVIKELGPDAEEIAVVEKHDSNWPMNLFSGMCRALDRRSKKDTFAELRAIIASLKEKGYAATEPHPPGPV